MAWIWILIIILATGIYLLNKNTNKITGMAGEFWVKNELKKLPDWYLVLNNVTLRNKEKFSQIDHIVFSKYGIFVIETKQYHGFLTGNDYDKNWTMGRGKNRIYIHNPIHQNYGHVLMLQEYLHIPEEMFIPLVCLSGEVKYRIKSKNVVPIYGLNKRIRSYTKPILENYAQLYHYVDSLNRDDTQTKQEHLEYAQRKKKENYIKSIGKCPKCGGDLVERKGKYGTFKGCSNYPKCKYIESNKTR